jgi:hypothetical protein
MLLHFWLKIYEGDKDNGSLNMSRLIVIGTGDFYNNPVLP